MVMKMFEMVSRMKQEALVQLKGNEPQLAFTLDLKHLQECRTTNPVILQRLAHCCAGPGNIALVPVKWSKAARRVSIVATGAPLIAWITSPAVSEVSMFGSTALATTITPPVSRSVGNIAAIFGSISVELVQWIRIVFAGTRLC